MSEQITKAEFLLQTLNAVTVITAVQVVKTSSFKSLTVLLLTHRYININSIKPYHTYYRPMI